jgi:hypothetical protein
MYPTMSNPAPPEPTLADYRANFHAASMVQLAPGRFRLHAEERAYTATLLDATPDSVSRAAAWVAALAGSPAGVARPLAA